MTVLQPACMLLKVLCALQTVANLARAGCVAVVPLVLMGGLGMTAVAVRVWWQSLKPGYAPLEPAVTI